MIKKITILVCLFLMIEPYTVSAQITPGGTENFITTWQTDNSGDSDNNQITIPVNTGSGIYNYDVYWEKVGSASTNGTITGVTGTGGDLTITFPSAGTYQVEIAGAFPHIYFNNSGDRQKILSIEQWGDIEWLNMNNAFHGASNLVINAPDAPDLTNVTDLSYMFRDAFSVNSDLDWDVSNVIVTSGMFYGASSFNGDISNWNVSNLITMTSMFFGASSFNGDISNWDVSGVTGMVSLFANAISFNRNLGNWDIQNVNNMTSMLTNSGLSTSNYDATLTGWANQNVQSGVTLGAGGLEYCEGQPARETLMNDYYNWNILGDSEASGCSPTPWPELSSPADGATDVSVQPILSWEAFTDATHYTLQLYSPESSDPNDPIYAVTNVTGTSYDIADGMGENLQYDVTYLWRVMAHTGSGDSPWSAEWSFTTEEPVLDPPSLVSPADEAEDVSVTPTLEWNAVSDADEYTVFVVWESDPFVVLENITETSTVVPAGTLDFYEEYEWTVVAHNEDGNSPLPGEVRTFRTVGPTVLVTPADEAEDVFVNPTFEWEPVAGIEEYTLLVADGGTYEEEFENITDTNHQVNGLEYATEYFWKVVAHNGEFDNDEIPDGPNIPIWSFTTEDVPSLDTPVLISPADEATDVSTSPTLTWDAVTGADDYTVQVGDEGGPLFEESINGTSYDLLGLDIGTTYLWRVMAHGDDGDSEWSDIWSFTTEDDASVQLNGSPGFRMLSSPVEVSLADLLAPLWTQGASGADYTGGDTNVWTWDNTVAGEDPSDWQEVTDLSATVSAGMGVLVYVFDEDDYGVPASAVWPKTLSVSGTVNTLPQSPTINTTPEGWTLLGNPVNTGIDWDDVTLTELENTVYVWDPAIGDYVFWNGSTGDLTNGVIHPFQGFFVQTSPEASSPSLEIPGSAATSPDDFFGKETDEEPLVVRLQMEGETGMGSTAWLQFSEQGSLTRNSTDAVKLQPLSADYATLALDPLSGDESSLLALKHLPLELDIPLEIPLTATATHVGRFTLEATDMRLPAGWSLSLRDTRTGEQFELEQGTDYSFKLEANEQLRKTPPYQSLSRPFGRGTQGGVQPAPQPRPLVRSSTPTKDVGTDGSQARFLLTVTPSGGSETDLPNQIALDQNYPNPFNPTTQISYQLPQQSQVRLEVYDMVGRQVATLVDGQVAAGAHQVNFDASNLSSGVYLYRLQTADAVFTKKLTLIK